jgi:GH25 family lysozyme M1 (1,4-beta-N-acetylmuramidase)
VLALGGLIHNNIDPVTLFGWDASHYDWDRGPMNLAAAKTDGMTFFSHKIGEGSSYTDPRFSAGVARARDTGFEFIGAYYVLHSSNPSGQADRCVALADALAPWWRTFPGWFWQVDAELWPDDFPPPSAVRTICDRLVQLTNRRVLLYAIRGHYGNSLTGINHPLWNADYGSDPVGHFLSLYPGDFSPRWAPYSGQVPTILQYSSQARIGTQPGCDANAYRGSLEEFRTLISGVAMPDNINDLADLATALADGSTKSGMVTGIAGPHVIPNTLYQVRTTVESVRNAVASVAADVTDIKAKLGAGTPAAGPSAQEVGDAEISPEEALRARTQELAELKAVLDSEEQEINALRAAVSERDGVIAQLREALAAAQSQSDGVPAPPAGEPSTTGEDEPQAPPEG